VRRLWHHLRGAHAAEGIDVIVTAGRVVVAEIRRDGTMVRLEASGVRVLSDLCWCSISEPVFPTRVRSLVTNSGKYAHYGPGLSGRAVRFGSFADCVAAAVTEKVPKSRPIWLS
jgi:predicted aconitase